MKIYKASITYNNGDYDEWERWYTEASPWYTERSYAEKHIEKLNQFHDYICNKHIGNTHFICHEPILEEQDVMSEQTEMTFKDADFAPIEYIHHDGEFKITKIIFCPHNYGGMWEFFITIDDAETFNVTLSDTNISVMHDNYDKNSKFYRYDSSDKNKMLSVAHNFADSIKLMYETFIKEYNEANSTFEKMHDVNNNDFDDPEYSKKCNESWNKLKLIGPNAIYELLKQRPDIKLATFALSDFEENLKRKDLSEDSEFYDIVSKIFKLCNYEIQMA